MNLQFYLKHLLEKKKLHRFKSQLLYFPNFHLGQLLSNYLGFELNLSHVVFKKKPPGDIITLHLCTKYLDDMIYSSWDIEHDRLKVEILHQLLPFTPPPPPPPLKTQKNQDFEKMKKIAEDIILQMCTKNHNHMMYGS